MSDYLPASWADHVGHATSMRARPPTAADLTHGQAILSSVIEGVWFRDLPNANPSPRCACPQVAPGRAAQRRHRSHSVGLHEVYEYSGELAPNSKALLEWPRSLLSVYQAARLNMPAEVTTGERQ